MRLQKVSLSKLDPFKSAWERWTFSKDEGKRLFEEIKSRLSMYVVYERYGGSLYRGANPQATYCILHQDTKRSAKVAEDFYCCYAGCGSGDVLWVLRKLWDGVPMQAVLKGPMRNSG